MNIKFKILDVFPADKSVLVNYYTDELVTAMQPTWDSRSTQLQSENPDWTKSQAMTQAKKDYPAGTVLGVTIYPDPAPTGQALIDYIYSYAPGDWLVTKSKETITPDTALHTELETLRGQEYTKIVTYQMAPMALASEAPVSVAPTDFVTHTVI